MRWGKTTLCLQTLLDLFRAVGAAAGQATLQLLIGRGRNKDGHHIGTVIHHLFGTLHLNLPHHVLTLVKQAADNDNISTIYCVNDDDTFYGAIELRDLVLGENNELPDLSPVVAEGTLELEPATIAFIVFKSINAL